MEPTAAIAQLVEQRFCKPQVVGSKPTRSTIPSVAQLGSATALGAVGREFKSLHSDHYVFINTFKRGRYDN